MNPKKSPALRDATEQISALIETLHETEQRLEELTAGEVDTEANRNGRTFLLRRAQDQLRYREAAKQTAILNALPAHIALLDAQGLIISVNEAWRRFVCADAIQGPGHRIGLNYLDICDSARGDGAPEAHQVAEGIRSVLAGRTKSFSIEYACHSPTDQRWFLVTVTPLADDGYLNGAVVMHSAVTAQRKAQESLRTSELRFRQMAENIGDVFFLQNLDRSQIFYVSPAYERIWGRTCESLYANPVSWADSIHPDDVESASTKFKDGRNTGFDCEFRIVRPDGNTRWIHARGFPILDDAGNPYRIAGVCSDITERKRAETEVRTLSRAMEQSPASIIITDRASSIEYVNPRFEQVTGYTKAEVVGKNPSVLKSGKNPPEVYEQLWAAISVGGEWRGELCNRRKNGELFWEFAAISGVRSENGEIEHYIAVKEDITERKEAQDRIRRLNRVYAVLSGINTLIVRVGDRDELFREACRIAVEEGGFRLCWIGIVDRSAMQIVPVASAGDDDGYLELVRGRLSLLDDAPAGHGVTAIAVRQKQAVVVNEVESDSRVRHKKAHADRGLCAFVSLPILIADEPVATLDLHAAEAGYFDEEEMRLLRELAGDIAFAIDHIDKQERLDYLAYYDALTGLANRSLFLERVSQYMRSAISEGHKLALFLIDLERFKNINDTLGQAAGDSLLKQVAEWLTHSVGDANLLARVGADHFAVVVPEVKQEGDVARLIEKTMEGFLEHPFRLNDAVFRVAAKVGIGLFPDDGADAETLFKNAEAALKKAKAAGDRYLFYTQKMTEMVAGKLTLENHLRQALDKEEFVLHYQPKVNLQSGRLTGAEALIRWNDPRTGLVPPGRFIPILEETGLIFEVGRWALRKAIEDYLRWRAAGLSAVRIAVNVSPLQLRNRGFISEIEKAIGIDEHAAAGLELEITEGMIMEDVKHSIASLQAIRAMGVTIAIDDFGTGFSSLSYLAKLPVDTLKIDRSFVIDMTTGPEGLALVSTIINLAHGLKLKVVAEGVETEEQSRLLRLLNCDEMQGFLFSKPVPGEIFETRFLTHLLAA